MYKVFINNRPLTFGTLKENNKKNIPYLNESAFDVAIDLLSKNAEEVHIYGQDLDGIWQNFKHHFKKVKAAGGIVLNSENQILWIHRLGLWDLPKGKMEKGEDKETTALREVEEECGIGNLNIVKRLPNTYHMYYHKQYILKITYWYEMNYTGNEPLIPQVEEGITAVKWFAKDALDIPLAHTYANIDELVHAYLNHKTYAK